MIRFNLALGALVLLLASMGCHRESEPRGEALRKAVRLSLPAPPHAQRAALAPTGSSQIWVVPAESLSAPNHQHPSHAFSQGELDLTNNSVLLSVPLGEPVRLLRHNYSGPPSPGDLALGTGLSEVLTFSGTQSEATVSVPITNAPYLLSSTPADGGSTYEAAQFVLGFDQAMRPESLISDEGGTCGGTVFVKRLDNGVCDRLSPLEASADRQVFTFKGHLAFGVDYELFITPSARAETGLYLPQTQKVAFKVGAGPITSTGGSSTTSDGLAPKLESLYPANGATGVSAGSQVRLVFSEPVQPASLTLTTSGTACGGAVQLSKDNFTTCVPFSGLPATTDNQTFFLTPSALSETTTYKLRVSQAIQDLAGNGLDKNYIMTTGFTTSDTVAPQLASSSPANGAISHLPSGAISLTFSEAMAPASITVIQGGSACAGSLQLSKDNFDTCIPFTAQPTTTDNRTFTLTPNTLAEGTQHKLRLTTSANDSYGNPATASTLAFKSTVTPSKVYAGKDWMTYIKNNGANVLASTGAACDGSETSQDGCINAGQYYLVAVTGKNSCTGLSATDSAGAFVWRCHSGTNPVGFYPVRFNQNKGLRDLLDWSSATPTWKNLSITVQASGSAYVQSTPATFGANTLKVQNTAGTLSTGNQFYLITQDPQGTFTVSASNIAIITKPGLSISGTASTSETLFDQTSQSYVWYEVNINSPDDYYALKATTSKWVTLNASTIYIPGPTLNTAVLMQGTKWIHVGSVKVIGGRTAFNIGSSGVTHPNYLDFHHVDIGPYGKISLTNLLGVRSYDLRLSESTTYDALTLTSSSQINQYALFQDLKLSNAGSDLAAFNGTFKGLVLSGVVHSGWQTGNDNLPSSGILQHYTGANVNWRAVQRSNPNGLSLHNHFYYNTGGGILFSNGARNSQIHDVAMTHPTTLITTNGTSESNPTYITGKLIYNPGSIPSCTTNNTVIGNGYTSNCAAAAPSSYNLTGKTGMNNAVVGQLGTADTTNTTTGLSGVSKLYDYTTDWLNPTIADWLNWEHDFRLWTKAPSSSWPDSGNRSRCETGMTCTQVDLALKASDTTVRAVHSTLPTGNDVIRHVFQDVTTSADCAAIPGAVWGPNFCSHPAYSSELACGSCADGTSVDYGTCLTNNQVDQWTGPKWCTVISSSIANCGTAGGTIKSHNWKSNKCHITFLKHAEEIWGDGIGNDNALCESNEACLFTPNLGAYQGHGSLVSAGSFTDGTITGVTLYKYSTNGY